jgi:predicted AAA+ superfamily ATPase
MHSRRLAPILLARAAQYPVVTLTGPRQSGKTTLCKHLFPDLPYRSLESMDHRAFAQEDPRGFLKALPDGAILDEIQRVPDLVSYLQEEVDRDARPGRFILTGSENLAVSATVTQSLAGRTAMLTLLPLSQDERAAFPGAPGDLWSGLLAGGYPRIFDRGLEPGVWLADYAATYVERDVQQLLRVADLRAFSTFLTLAAGRTGQELNASALSGDAGVSVNTIRAWLSVLEASYLITLLPAWHPNTRKQTVKAPKLHFLDSGLACHLLGIRTPEQLAAHPLRGAIFESWVVSEAAKAQAHAGLSPRLFHYRESRGPEVDLLAQSGNGWIFAEAKSGSTVDATFLRPMTDLEARFPPGTPVEKRLVYGGEASHMRQGVAVTGWARIQDRAW